MSWHRFRTLYYDVGFTGESFSFPRIGRKTALKKPCCKFKDCKKESKCKEYKNKKTCTLKPGEGIAAVLHSTVEHPPCCSSDRKRNKRINTDYLCVPETDIRETKKRTRYTEAARVRSPCSILSLQSKKCQGNPYIMYGPCGFQQNEDEDSRADARCNINRTRYISTDRCPQIFYKPTCNESTMYNPDITTCANELPCILNKAVQRKFRNTKSLKKLKNKKIGGDACMCYVDATTSTNGKSLWSKTITPRKRECSPYKCNPKTYEDPCCKYYVEEATNSKNKSCCSEVRPRIDEQTSNFDFVDEATGTNDKIECSKIIRPRIPEYQKLRPIPPEHQHAKCSKLNMETCDEPTKCYVDEAVGVNDRSGCSKIIRPRIPECQKLRPIPPEHQHAKCSKEIIEPCDEPTKCYVDAAVGVNDGSGCSKIIRPRIPFCEISTPGIPKCQNYERNNRKSHSCTDYCKFYTDSATDTQNKAGCFKVIRPKLRECRKPKWYDKLKKKSCVGCDCYKNVSTSTKPKSRCLKSKIIRPRIHEYEYSRCNFCGKTKPCTCCEDNVVICKCQRFKWKKFFRRKSIPCLPENTCGRKSECESNRNRYMRYVNVEDDYCRPVSPLYGVSEQCSRVKNSGQSALTQARDLMIKSSTNKLLLGPSNESNEFDFQCYTDPCREVYYRHPYSRKIDCGVITSSTLMNAYLCSRPPCAKYCKSRRKPLCVKFRLSNCFEHLVMGTVAVFCAPCFLIAMSFWFVCYLFTDDCEADETFRKMNYKDVRILDENCNGIQRKCFDSCIKDEQNSMLNASPEYTIEKYDDKAMNTGCISNPRTKKNKKRISKCCKKKSCFIPQRKYNLYYVDDRGWVMKPILDGACGGGDNNLNPDICSSPKRIICDRLNYDSCCNTTTGPNVFSPKKTLFCERLNNEDPCCNSRDPDKCPSQTIFCERVNYECDYEDPLYAPHKTTCNTCEHSAGPETVYREGVNYQDACCSSPEPNRPSRNRFFQDPCACYYNRISKDCRVLSGQPWRPNDSCTCLWDCECPNISFWKWLFCKSKTGNKPNNKIQGSKNHQPKKGNYYQKTKIGNSYEKSKNGSSYNRPIRSEHNKAELGSSYRKSKQENSYLKSKMESGGVRSVMRIDYRKSRIQRVHYKSKMGRAYRKSKMRMLRYWRKCNRADKKFRSETEAACREMVKDAVQLRPSMKEALGEFFRSAFRILRYLLVSCCCCPVFFCFYCCNMGCYSMYCKAFC